MSVRAINGKPARIDELIPCPVCQQSDTVSLAMDDLTAVSWCSCGVVYITDGLHYTEAKQRVVHNFCPK